MMDASDPEEEAFVRAALMQYRKARAKLEEPLPQIEEKEFRKRLRRISGLMAPTSRDRVVATLRRIADLWPTPGVSNTFEGPKVKVQGTLTDLRVSWRDHENWNIDEACASADVLRRHREAVVHYCRALELDWVPPQQKYEARARSARSRRSEIILLPEDFIDLVNEIVNHVVYHEDPDINEMYRHRGRANFFTGPRTPSEDNRLAIQDVRYKEGSIVYYQSKVGAVDSENIFIPRVVDELSPTVLSWTSRRSIQSWNTKSRATLIRRGIARGALEHDHGIVWVGANGLPMDPDTFRRVFGSAAEEVWEGFYNYLTRELAIIMKALEIRQEVGQIDIPRLARWTGHRSWNNLQRYVRKAEELFRVYKPGPELDALLHQWRLM